MVKSGTKYYYNLGPSFGETWNQVTIKYESDEIFNTVIMNAGTKSKSNLGPSQD